MPLLPKHLSDRIPRWQAHIAFWDWVFRALWTIGAVAVGWWTATMAWAEGVIVPYGTVGYVGTILAIALSLTLIFALAAWAVKQLRGTRPIDIKNTVDDRPAEGTTFVRARGTSNVQILRGEMHGYATAVDAADSAHVSADDTYFNSVWSRARASTIQVASLVRQSSYIVEGRQFYENRLLGPGCVIFGDGCELNQPIFITPPHHTIDGVLIEVEDGRLIYGAVAFRNCTFIRCIFDGISIICTSEQADKIRRNITQS